MCLPIHEVSPVDQMEPFAHLASEKERKSSILENKILFQILAKIYSHYEYNETYLLLKGRIEYSKTTLLSIVKLADQFFQNSSNKDQDCCQINISPLDDIAAYPSNTPVTIKSRATLYSLDPKDQAPVCTTDEVASYENIYIAEHISRATFYIHRDWKIWRLPSDFEKEKLFEGNHSDVYKIFDLSEGQWLILKVLGKRLAEHLGPNANERVSHRFRVIHDIFQEAQGGEEEIPLQEPPFALIDMRQAHSKIVRGIVENYYADGDLFNLMTSKQYSGISLLARLIFCKNLANYFSQLTGLGIYHPDIKPENVLIKTVGEVHQLFIGDYLDSLRFEKLFRISRAVLKLSEMNQENVDGINPQHVKLIQSLNYLHTRSYMHTRDWKTIQKTIEAIKAIFKQTGSGSSNRVEQFEAHAQVFADVAVKHQIFALGCTFIQILCQRMPYSNHEKMIKFYPGEAENPIHPHIKFYLVREMLKLSPHSTPLVKKVTAFVLSMLAADYLDRPDFDTVVEMFDSSIAELTDHSKKVSANQTASKKAIKA